MPSGSGMLDLKIAVICASNMNRSMEAHSFLRWEQDARSSVILVSVSQCRFAILKMLSLCFSKRGFNVMSFGTNDKVKLPGQSIDKPNCYEFGVTYDEIYKDLVAKDHNLYPFPDYYFNIKCRF